MWMHRIVLGMEFSEAALAAQLPAVLGPMDGIRVSRGAGGMSTATEISVVTDDPDVPEIVRELCWELDPLAAQTFVRVYACESARGSVAAR